MENTEDLDLDSLMGLLDDNETFEEDKGILPSYAAAALNSPFEDKTAEVPPPQNRSKVLKDMFREDLFLPQKVQNPKEEIPCDPYLKWKKQSVVHADKSDSSDDEGEGFNETNKMIKKAINKELCPSHFQAKRTTTSTWAASKAQPNNASKRIATENPVSADSFSGIRIVNPLVTFSVLQQRMQGRKMIKMSFIQNCVKGGDIEGDWVTMGVVVGKIPAKTSKNGKTYSIWKMSDLHDPEKLVSVFLFKSAHTDHWKTTIGTVIGILNPSILPDKDKCGNINLSVDHPGKFMIMGKSKDLGFCKSQRKDGTVCNVAVNVLQCEYCTYHVKKEYKRFSAKRGELQAAYSGREPSLKNKMLKGQSVFYGGQSFTALGKKPTNQVKSRDKLTLLNLGLKRKAADALESVEREKGVKKLTDIYGPDILKVAEKNSEFINDQLALPTAGSRNLLQHLMKDKAKKAGEPVQVISPKELLRLRDNQRSARGSRQKDDSLILKNLTPQIGRGLCPGQNVSLDFISPNSGIASSSHNYAKMKAIQRIKENGPIKRKDPNSVKISTDSSDKIKTALNKSFEEKEATDTTSLTKQTVVKSRLGTLDLNSEKVKQILSRKSNHAYEVEMVEMEKEAAYFNVLEKKEQMEEKMSSTTEIVCDVVSCKKCKYTAHTAADRCKQEQHPLKCHKALKRFFACKNCRYRTFCFTKFPTISCRNCRSSNFERTSMMKSRSGPKLDSEILNICGDEAKYLNSLSTETF